MFSLLSFMNTQRYEKTLPTNVDFDYDRMVKTRIFTLI